MSNSTRKTVAAPITSNFSSTITGSTGTGENMNENERTGTTGTTTMVDRRITTGESNAADATDTTMTEPAPATPAEGGRIKYYRNRLGMLVNHRYTQFVVILFIAINSLMLGIATCAFVKDDPDVTFIFETADQIFLIIFTVELICQFIYLGRFLLCDPWLVFDLLLIVSSWVFQDLTVIRSFRIFRTLRLITRIKVMRNLVLALFSVVPRMIAIFFLLTLVSYIFAVMMTQLFKDLYSNDSNTIVTASADGTVNSINYFGRLDASFLTLFQLMTLDAWADVAEDVMTEYTWGWIPIIIYIIIAGFVVVNLVIAVICDAVSALKEDDKAKLHGRFKESRTPVDRKTKAKQRNRSKNATNLEAEAAMNGGPVEEYNEQPPQRVPQLAPTVASYAATETTTATSPLQRDSSLQSLLFEDPLTGLEQQVQELLQLQDSTIQHVVSITQQFQKARMEAMSVSMSTTPSE